MLLLPFLLLLLSECNFIFQDLHGRQVKVNFANERPRAYPGSYGNSPYGNAGGNATGVLNTTGYPGDVYESDSNPGNRAGNNYGTDDNTRSSGGGYGYGSFPSGNTYNDGTSGGYGVNNGNYAAAAGVGESNTVNYGSAPGGGYGNYGTAAPGIGNRYNYDNSAVFGSSGNNFNVAGGGSSSEYPGSAMGYGTFGMGTGGDFGGGAGGGGGDGGCA